MQIGFVRSNERVVEEGGERKKVKYFEMFIKPVFGEMQGFTLTKNTSDVPNTPFYTIYAHKTQGWIGRRMKVGALWLKETDAGEKFMSGYIETPLVVGGKLHISMWKTKPLYEGENIEDWQYDIVWKPYVPEGQKGELSVPYVPTDIVEDGVLCDDEELPF